jgi:hypothetical protein
MSRKLLLERVPEFPCLFSVIYHFNKITNKISMSVKKGNRAYCTHKSLVTKKLSSEQSKNTFFMTLIGPVVTSGCET